MAVPNGIAVLCHCDLRIGRDWVRVREVDLEGHRYEAISEREKDICCNGRNPAPQNQLREFERWVSLRGEVLHVDGEVKGEAEE